MIGNIQSTGSLVRANSMESGANLPLHLVCVTQGYSAKSRNQDSPIIRTHCQKSLRTIWGYFFLSPTILVWGIGNPTWCLLPFCSRAVSLPKKGPLLKSLNAWTSPLHRVKSCPAWCCRRRRRPLPWPPQPLLAREGAVSRSLGADHPESGWQTRSLSDDWLTYLTFSALKLFEFLSWFATCRAFNVSCIRKVESRMVLIREYYE